MKKILLLSSVLLGSSLIMAQGAHESDSLGLSHNYTNMLDYVYVKRYRPTDSLYRDSAFSRNIYFSVYGLGEANGLKSSSLKKPMPGFGLSVGKEWGKYHDIRLSAAYILGQDDLENTMMAHDRFDVKADYLFNLTSYLMGYDPGQIYSLRTVAGLGLTYTPDAVHRLMPHLQAGLNFRFHANKHLYLYAEPTLMLYPSASDVESLRNSKLKWTPRLEVGALYNFTPHQPNKGGYENESWMDEVFIQAGLGGTFPAGVLKGASCSSKGATGFVHLGKWYGLLGARLGLFTQGWVNQPESGMRLHGFLGGRVEGMLNLNTLFRPEKKDPRFEANAFLGWELGAVGFRGSDAYSSNSGFFQGLTFGGDLVYFLTPQTGLFLEGRYQAPSYHRSLSAGGTVDYKPHNLSVALGLEIRRRDTEFRDLKAANGSVYHPYWFVDVSGGLTEGIQSFSPYYLKRNLGGMGRFSFGRSFTPESSVRVTLGTSNLKSSVAPDAHPVVFGVDYGLDLLNYIIGYDPYRRMGFGLWAGAHVLHNAKHSKTAVGGTLGLEASVHATRHWDIYLEPSVRFYGTDVFDGNRNLGGLRGIADLHLGARYKFAAFPGTFNSSVRKDWADGFFFRVATGMNKIMPGEKGHVGGLGSISVGKWFNFLGLRLSAFGTYTFDARKYAQTGVSMDEHTQYLGGRLEGMISLSDFWKQEEVSPIDVSLIGGWAFGRVRNTSYYNAGSNVQPFHGYAFSTQVKWNVTPHVGLFLEPRFQQLFYTYEKSFSDEHSAGSSYSQRYKAKMFELEAGVEIQNRGMDHYRESKAKFEPYHFLTGSFQAVLPLKIEDRRKVDMGGGIGYGYHFTPLSAARFSVDFGSYKAGERSFATALSLDYLFSLSNWTWGYDPDRRFYTDAVFGLGYTFSENALNKNNKDVAGVFGLRTGMRVGYNFLPQVSLYAEPVLQFHFGRISSGFWMRDRASFLPGVHIGLQYRF